MSRFYQKYLSGLKASGDASAGASSPTSSPIVNRGASSTFSGSSSTYQMDPTAGARPMSMNLSKGGGAGGAGGGGGGGGFTRRIQINNNSDAFSPDETRELQVFAKPESSRQFLRGALSVHYLFESLGEEDMTRIVDSMRPTFAAVDEAIIREGDLGDLFYCLESGQAEANIEAQGKVMEYTSGNCFGELALIYNSPRAASVIATAACKLWALDLRTFRFILATTSSSKMVVRCEFLKKCAFLDPLNNDQIGKLAGALDPVSFEEGEYILRQGEQATSFFIIEEGNVRCTQIKSTGREVDLISLKKGDYFGEMALMLNETRHANCVAVGKVKCFSLERAKFDSILGPVQEMLAKRMRIRILQSVPLLSRLSESKLVKLAGVMRVQAFVDGSYIIRQGEEGSRFYIINEGEVRCTRTKGAEEEELIRLTAQEFFGERALIHNEVRKANIIAVGPVECLVLERSSFQTLLTDVQDDIVDAMERREASAPPAEEAAPTGPKTSYPFSELRVMRTIGTGTFGRVKMVQHVPTGLVCALKCMNKAEVVESHQERNIMAEKNLLFECSSSVFVLQLLQTFNTPNQIMMLMEFIQGGELWSYIYEKTDTVTRNPIGGFEMSAVKFYSANVILGFKHLHGKGIAYRDLKPENLLIDHLGYVKIIDFGFAKKLPFMKGETRQDKTFTLCGTPEYLAPEIVMSKGYDKSVDYWALGCLIYELFVGRTPFQADYTTKIFQNIVASEKNLAFPQGMQAAHVALCRKLLSPNPAFRLGNLSGGVDDIINDPFFAGYDWESIMSRQLKSPYCPPVKDALDTSNFDHYDEEAQIPTYSGSQACFDGF